VTEVAVAVVYDAL